MAATLIVPVVDEGLGNSAYLYGERAATAAGVLERAGHTGVAVLLGSPPDRAGATGRALESGA